MAELTSIRTAIKTTLETNIAGFHCYESFPENARVFPCAVVVPTRTDYHVAMGRGTDTQEFTLLVLVSYNELTVSQNNLNPLVSGSGPLSIRECIFNNRDLGVNGWQATISSMFDYGIRFEQKFQGAAIDALGARMGLTVYTRGSS